MKAFATIGFVTALTPCQFVAAQSTIVVEDVNALVRLSANQSDCEWKVGPLCFESMEFTAESMADFPLLVASEGSGPQGEFLTGSASTTASLEAEGLTIEQRAYGPGSECCFDDYFFFHARAETEIRFNLPQTALVRFTRISDTNFYDPEERYTANGEWDCTLTNNSTGNTYEENEWNQREIALEAGSYTISMSSYGWTSCNCSSTISQTITIADRPIPDQVVVRNHDTFVYHQIEGEDNFLDNHVAESIQIDDLDDLPSHLHGFLPMHPEEGGGGWYGRGRANANITPNRLSVSSMSQSDAYGWSDYHRRWNAQTYSNFTFDLTEISLVDINWCMQREENINSGESVGSNMSRFRLFNTDLNQVILDSHLEEIGSECDSMQLELQPGHYVIWCDAVARIVDPDGSMHRISRTEIDMVFHPRTPGDLNGDGQINGADLGILISMWGPCPECPEDLNGDGQVDGADIGLFIASWTG